MGKTALLWAILSACNIAWAASSEEWKTRSVYQVLTDRYARTDNDHSFPCNPSARVYCGGSYRGLINNLDYIQEMGFTAVWISPVTKNIEGTTGWGEAYHGYWQQDLFSLNHHFGTALDLRDLSDELHRRRMLLMIDVVVNHFAWPGPPNTTDFSLFNPFNEARFFHPFCKVTNYDVQEMVENCWLGDSNVELVDVNTELPEVASTFSSWISQIVSNYSVDGLRIDTAKHVAKSFWPEFCDAAGVFCTGEVLSPRSEYTYDYQNYMQSVLNYPMYYPLRDLFLPGGNITDFVMAHRRNQVLSKNPFNVLNFASNHDIPRLASIIQPLASRKNAIAYTMMSDGIPTVYQGDEHGFSGKSDPENREALWLSGFNKSAPLFTMVQALNRLRYLAGDRDTDFWASKSEVIWHDNESFAMQKGKIITVLTNRATLGPHRLTSISDPKFAAGTSLVDVLTCELTTVGERGILDIMIVNNDPIVLYPTDDITASNICHPWLS